MTSKTQLAFGDLTLDTAAQRVFQGSNEILLRKKEFQLLQFLAIHKNRVLNRLTILEYVWNYSTCAESNTLEVHMANLRRKLKKSSRTIIQTIHGVGYRLL